MGACLSNQIRVETPFQGARIIDENSPASLLRTDRTEDEILESSNLRSFHYDVLKKATKNFRQKDAVAEDGFGSVFKGWIKEMDFTASKPGTGMVIAVKMLNSDGYQGHSEFSAEIKYLSVLDHPSFIKLVGYCLENEHQLLAYEFMECGSLDNYLFRNNSSSKQLSWSNRMKISLDAAKGLAYLHSDKVNVIFRDFKASNILLDSNYNAKLYGLGLAKNGPIDDEGGVSTRVIGTYGYAAPEYIATGRLTAKCDVYAFGVVLLETLTGKRVTDAARSSDKRNLVEWAVPLMRSKSKLLTIMDAQIEGQYSISAAQKAAKLATQCLSADPRLRPDMPQVVSALEQLQNDTGTSK